MPNSKKECGWWRQGQYEVGAGDRVVRRDDPNETVWRVQKIPEERRGEVPEGHAPIEPEERDRDVRLVDLITEEVSNLERIRCPS